MVMAVAVYATKVTVSVKTKKAATVDLSPADGHTNTHVLQRLNIKTLKNTIYYILTNQKIDDAAEDDRGNGAQCDVGQDLRQEVHRHSVVATDVLMPFTRETHLASVNLLLVSPQSFLSTHTNSFLSMMKSSAADTVLKHWLVVMKKRAPILQNKHNNIYIQSFFLSLVHRSVYKYKA